MAYQIDQSGKIEHTNKPTVVALSNGKTKTIKISAKEKQRLLATLRDLEYPKSNYIYKIFAALIFILVKNEIVSHLEVDKEYFGNESVIKDTLIFLYSSSKRKMPEIYFVLVGKKSNAHKSALGTFQKKMKPNTIVKAEELLKILYATKKGRRSKSSLDNP